MKKVIIVIRWFFAVPFLMMPAVGISEGDYLSAVWMFLFGILVMPKNWLPLKYRKFLHLNKSKTIAETIEPIEIVTKPIIEAVEVKPKPKSTVGGVIVLLVLVAIIAGVVITAKNDDSPKTASKDSAFIVSKSIVKTTYDLPVMDFPFQDYRFDDLKFNSYIIESYFDTKNQFNAPVRVHYRTKLHYNGTGDVLDSKNWEVQDLKTW